MTLSCSRTRQRLFTIRLLPNSIIRAHGATCAPFLIGGELNPMTAKKHLKMTNPGEVRRAMTRVSNMVLNGEITPQQANALIYAGNAVLSSIRADEQERRLNELEAKLTELENDANE